MISFSRGTTTKIEFATQFIIIIIKTKKYQFNLKYKGSIINDPVAKKKLARRTTGIDVTKNSLEI